MNKQTFIENLNLYLDDELPEQQSAELLRAVRSNAEYHRIYMQYCQMNKACSMMANSFSEETPSSRSSLSQKLYAIGGMAAAIALLFVAGQNIAPMIGNGGSPAPVANGDATQPAPAIVVAAPTPTFEYDDAVMPQFASISAPSLSNAQPEALELEEKLFYEDMPADLKLLDEAQPRFVVDQELFNTTSSSNTRLPSVVTVSSE